MFRWCRCAPYDLPFNDMHKITMGRAGMTQPIV